MKTFLFLGCVFAMNFAVAEQSLRFTHSIVMSEIVLGNTTVHGQDFTSLHIENHVFHGRVGYPKLPAKTRLLEVPIGAEVEIRIISSEYQDISLGEKGFFRQLLPVQPPIRKSATHTPPLAKNQAVFLQDFFTERNLVDIEDLGIARDRRFVQINILPVRYLPIANKIRVYYFIEFEVNITPCRDAKLRTSTPGASNNPVYKIISDRTFETALAPFVDWKTEIGFDVRVSFTDEPEVGNTPTSIRAFLKDIFNSPYRANYLLLVGDAEHIPPFSTSFSADSEIILFAGGHLHVTDFYFAEYTGDNLPDVFFGRLSASTPQELSNQIEKIIFMEKLAIAQTEFLGNSLFIAGWDERFPMRRYLDATINYAMHYYFNAKNHINATALWSANTSGRASQILSTINSGVGFVNFTGHGSWNHWNEPRITVSDILSLSNLNMYPVVISNACFTNSFDQDVSFGEALMRAERRGAVAHIGATNSTFFTEDFQWSVGAVGVPRGFNPNDITRENSGLGVFDKMFEKPDDQWKRRSLGEIMFYGNMAVQLGNATFSDEMKRFYWEVYHILGDPSFRPHLFDPNNSPPTSISGVNRTPEHVGFDVFLNNGILNIEVHAKVPSRAAIRLYNIAGQPVATVASSASIHVGQNNFSFDMFSLPRGIFICRFLDENGVISRKIVW